MIKTLIQWYNKSARNLPWRETRDPYKIWLSEIILQQTRVDQGINYYNKFILNYPTVHDLAQAKLDDILLLWQGLGYYSRARNLYAAAQFLVENYNGRFPREIEELKKLKGVGDYTAAAIGSIAFGIPEAAVDGNVYRVLSRFYEDSIPIDSTKGQKHFKAMANQVLERNNPGIHNQAMMELGATICKPKSPECTECPLSNECGAYGSKTYHNYPVKKSKTYQKHRYFYYLVIRSKNSIIIEKRQNNDIWKGLFQFPLLESEKNISVEELIGKVTEEPMLKDIPFSIGKISGEIKHILSHQIIHAYFVEVKLNEEISIWDNGHLLIKKEELDKYAFPRLITRYFETEGIS